MSDIPLLVAKLAALASAAGTGLYLALGVEPSEGVGFLLSAMPFWAVVIWLERDTQRTRVGAVHDLGLLATVGWWAFIPWYTLKTRGRAGVRLMAGLFTLIAAPLVGAVITILLLVPLRLLGLW
jgi:hypothetical protein